MKGMMMFFTILLLVTAIVIIAAYSPLYQGAAQAGQLSAERYASEISGIINIMQQSPPGTSHSYELPDKECILTLGDRVTMTLSPGEKEAKAQSVSVRSYFSGDQGVMKLAKFAEKLATEVTARQLPPKQA